LTDLSAPTADATHYSARWGVEKQLKWERHTEFSTFTFISRRHDTDYFSDLPKQHVPAEWFHAIEGKRFAAIRLELVSGEAVAAVRSNVHRWIDTSTMVGSNVMGEGQVFCDWAIKPDGFSRFLVLDHGLGQVQGGRLLQRLYEIEAYRMMALLTLPVARELGLSLDEMEKSLEVLMDRMDVGSRADDDAELLSQLTHLAVGAETLAGSSGRFSASRASQKLVQARIRELLEERIDGMPTIAQFLERRFGPAMETCKAIWQRHEQFAGRVARAVDLLRTRRVPGCLRLQDQSCLICRSAPEGKCCTVTNYSESERSARHPIEIQEATRGRVPRAPTRHDVCSGRTRWACRPCRIPRLRGRDGGTARYARKVRCTSAREAGIGQCSCMPLIGPTAIPW
jgi:uncharacterized membrane-anchored protein